MAVLASRSVQLGVVRLVPNIASAIPASPVAVPLHVGPETQAYLEKLMAAVPANKRGVAKLIIDLKGVDVSVGTHVGQIGPFDVDASAGAGVSWSGGKFVGGEIRIEW